MASIGSIGSGSSQIGSRLAQLLETPGLKQTDLLTQLNGLIQEQEQDVTLAEKLHPPGPINAAHQRAIDALGLRVGGMKGLADVFRSTATTSDSVQAATITGRTTRMRRASARWRGIDDIRRRRGFIGPPLYLAANSASRVPRHGANVEFDARARCPG